MVWPPAFVVALFPVSISLIVYGADPQAGDTPTYSVFVNGGESPSSNFSMHEAQINTFYYTLFKGKAAVLNAGGPGTQVVPVGSDGLIKRGQDGLWKLEPSQFKGPVKAASLKEFRGRTSYGRWPTRNAGM